MTPRLREILIGLVERVDLGKRARHVFSRSDLPLHAETADLATVDSLVARGLIRRELSRTDRLQGLPGSIIPEPNGIADLANLLGYQRLHDRVDAAARHFFEHLSTSTWVSDCAREILEAWRAGRKAFGLSESDAAAATDTLAFLSAISKGRHQGKDARQFSVDETGDSKRLERVSKHVASALREAFGISGGSSDDVFERVGMTVFPNPVLVGGKLRIKSTLFDALPYIGLAPEMVDSVSVDRPEFILSIENLASFHRYLREVPGDGIVVYSGGFPSRATLALLKSLAEAKTPFFHWGDIDPGGVSIFRSIETAIAAPVHPHLMSPDLAAAGSPSRPDARLRRIADSGSRVASLAQWLLTDAGRCIEQEKIPPIAPHLP